MSATGTGEINFAADVTSIDKSNNAALKNGDSFSLWMTKDLANIGSVATTATYNGSMFVNSPAIYWSNGSTNYYFDRMAKGKHVVETEYYIDRTGTYETGLCTVGCAYAPEFRGTAKSMTIKVKK